MLRALVKNAPGIIKERTTAMKIGITERGDAGLDLSWRCKLQNVDGAILITKDITQEFIQAAVTSDKPLIVHCTCTGYGGTPLEPNVPYYQVQLDHLKELIDRGFKAENCVLRIDPIMPTEGGIKRVHEVIDYFIGLKTQVNRIRVSIVDEYPHVRERYRALGIASVYHGGFSPSFAQMKMVANALNQYGFTYETCAEDKFVKMLDNGVATGCVGHQDIQLMGLPEYDSPFENPQNRKGCHCLPCKTELLSNKARCAHGCLYCYWKN